MGDVRDPTLAKPSWWFEHEIQRVIRRYQGAPMDEDLARLAISDMNHFADRVFKFCEQQAPSYLENRSVKDAIINVAAGNRSLDLIRRVCNAQKHHLIKRERHYFAASDQIVNWLEDIWITDEEGGPTLSVGAALLEAEQFWRKWLQDHPET